MALLDVSELLADPDFCDQITRIARSVTLVKGETTIAETSGMIYGSVQGAEKEDLEKVPEAAILSDIIRVYSNSRLYPERPSGYSDIIVWKGARYAVKTVPEDFMHFGGGHCMALAVKEVPNNG
jgi:hypothetical protein